MLKAFSLRRQLLWWLLLPQLALWAGGGVLAYRMALAYAEKGIDQSLTQSVWALSRQVKPIGSGLLIDFPRAAQDILELDPEDRHSYTVSSPPGRFLLGNAQLVQPPPGLSPELGEPVLYKAEVDGKAMRIVSLDLKYGESSHPQQMRVQVGKSLAVQQRIARELVSDLLAPLLALAVLLSFLVYGGISRGLMPLRRLTTQLEHRSVDALSPIELRQAPSEVHALVGAINGLLAKVARSVEQEKRFLSDAAHQLRTPLAGLVSQVELAQREASDPGLKDRLGKVRRGAERSAHLVHQLLSLARSEAAPRSQPLDLVHLAREVTREWTPRLLAAGLDIGFEGEGPVVVRADAVLLREALVNLLDNALRYTPAGTQVTVCADTAAGQARLSVQDTGPGVRTEDLARLFDRFWRASEQPGGCGLGLAIVQEVALRHGGGVQADHVGNGGLRMTLVLPLADPAAP